MSEQNQNDISAEAVDVLHKAYGQLQEQIRKVIVGQDEVIEQLLIGLFSQGHVLLEGVPGLAKTLTVSFHAKLPTWLLGVTQGKTERPTLSSKF